MDIKYKYIRGMEMIGESDHKREYKGVYEYKYKYESMYECMKDEKEG